MNFLVRKIKEYSQELLKENSWQEVVEEQSQTSPPSSNKKKRKNKTQITRNKSGCYVGDKYLETHEEAAKHLNVKTGTFTDWLNRRRSPSKRKFYNIRYGDEEQ